MGQIKKGLATFLRVVLCSLAAICFLSASSSRTRVVVSMGLTVRRKTAKNLAVRRKNERILAVSRKKNLKN